MSNLTTVSETTVYPDWRSAVEKFLEAGFTYGDRVAERWLASAFNLVPVGSGAPWETKQAYELAFLRNITEMRRFLLTERDMLIMRHAAGGYEVVLPGEQAIRSMDELNTKMTREFARASTRLRHTAIGLLDAAEQRKHADASARVAQLSGMMFGSRRRSARLELVRQAADDAKGEAA